MGPHPVEEDGNVARGKGPEMANPAFRFEVQQGGKLKAVGGLKRNQTNRAAAVRTPVNLPTWGHFAAGIRTFQEKGPSGNLAIATADHKDLYKQLPVREDHQFLAAAPLKGPASGRVRGITPKTQLFGATAAALNYDAFSRATAALAAMIGLF